MQHLLPLQHFPAHPNVASLSVKPQALRRCIQGKKDPPSPVPTPPRIELVVKQLVRWHGETNFEALLLAGGEKLQGSHVDSPSMKALKGKRLSLNKKVFSCLIAVQEGTAWMDSKRNRIPIAPGSMLIWRGDYRHSGAQDRKHDGNANKRIFFSISHPDYYEFDFDMVGDVISNE